MTGQRILVIDGDCNAARSIVQSLGAAGFRPSLAGARADLPAFASRYLDKALTCPDPLRDKTAFQEWFLDRQLADRIELVIPATESAAVPLHELRHHPDLRTRLALPPPEAFEISIDKERVFRLATDLGIPAPASLYMSGAAELDRPEIGRWLAGGAAVVKSHRSKIWHGKRGHEQRVRMARSEPELRRAAAGLLEMGPIQVQEWVPGRGVGVEMLLDRGEIVLCFAHERLHELPLTGGGSTYRRSIPAPPDLVEHSARLMRALGWHGVAMVEFRVDPKTGAAWMMELNGRFWGSLPLALAAGVDFPAALAQLLLHGVRPEPATPRLGVYARHVSRDIEWTKAIARRALRGRGDDGLILARPLLPSLVEWTRVIGGGEVWDGARLGDPGPMWRELSQYARAQASGVVKKIAGAVQAAYAARRASRLARRPGDNWPGGNVLVLCHGNVCRSAYAEQILRARRPRGIEAIRSAGLGARPGRSSPPRLVRVAKERGVDLSHHRARHVTPDDLRWADVILVMDERNYSALAAEDGNALTKAYWLGAFLRDGKPHIDDPIDGDDEMIAGVCERIEQALDALTAVIEAS